jgi:signal transduction histidine kinase
MQTLVEQTLEVLADARGEPAYEMFVQEVAEAARDRVASLARHRGVELGVRVDENAPLSSRVANLASLILVNLLENAIQATPAGRQVTLTVTRDKDRLSWRVQDEGPGLPAHLRERLFLPCRSTREGGSGLGLAISKQVADHLGATLDFEEPASGGCAFTLGLPLSSPDESSSGDKSRRSGVVAPP